LPQDQQRIFSPFTQGDASSTRHYVYGGTGLGLAVSSELVGLMGGQIGVVSELGRGSKFHFALALLRDVGAPPEPTPGRKLKILLAEDTPANQKLIVHILEKRGHAVDVARNGQEAVQRLGDERYDLILMDVQMPVLDGLRATAAIRAVPDRETSQIPIIALTAHAMLEDEERCLSAGMNAYIAKPIDGRKLVQLINRFAR
jgi:CheY-like chemotaxis protein